MANIWEKAKSILAVLVILLQLYYNLENVHSSVSFMIFLVWCGSMMVYATMKQTMQSVYMMVEIVVYQRYQVNFVR